MEVSSRYRKKETAAPAQDRKAAGMAGAENANRYRVVRKRSFFKKVTNG
jgi:hypothetical protein